MTHCNCFSAGYCESLMCVSSQYGQSLSAVSTKFASGAKDDHPILPHQASKTDLQRENPVTPISTEIPLQNDHLPALTQHTSDSQTSGLKNSNVAVVVPVCSPLKINHTKVICLLRNGCKVALISCILDGLHSDDDIYSFSFMRLFW